MDMNDTITLIRFVELFSFYYIGNEKLSNFQF